ncbi:MAG: hypothetical protein ACRCV9_15125 [Burkholderiaceae bacterium]
MILAAIAIFLFGLIAGVGTVIAMAGLIDLQESIHEHWHGSGD